jgi:glutamate synthase (NADPH/NADH) small chain
LLYGIPNFKMEKEVLETKVQYLRDLGVEFVCGTDIGPSAIDGFFDQAYHAVFLGHGASVGNQLAVPGTDLPGVVLATDFLVRGNVAPDLLPARMREPLPAAKRVLVIGGGDTSMDCVRTAVRLGAGVVTCAYRRTEAEQVGRQAERIHAREEGVRFEYLASPVQIEAGPDGRVASARFARMALGDPDESGRRPPEPTGDEFVIEAELVVVAIGYRSDEPLAEGAKVTHERDLVMTDERGQTSRPGIFAGGDCVNGADLVVTALADAQHAVAAMHEYLMRQSEAAA